MVEYQARHKNIWPIEWMRARAHWSNDWAPIPEIFVYNWVKQYLEEHPNHKCPVKDVFGKYWVRVAK